MATLLPYGAWAILLVAGGMMVVGYIGANDKSEGFWFEVARTGLGLFAVAILGGRAAAAFRDQEFKRERRLRQGEAADRLRAEFVSELWDAYHAIKTVRRALNASGLPEAQTDSELSAAQLDALKIQMPRLNEAQLTLEKLKQTVELEHELFAPHQARLEKLLRGAEQYARKVLRDWETKEWPDWKRLNAFAGSSKPHGGGGIGNLSDVIDRATVLVYELRSERALERASESTSARTRRGTNPAPSGSGPQPDATPDEKLLYRLSGRPA